jgi:hypothetical protein
MHNIKLDLTGPEFGDGKPQLHASSEPGFKRRLKKLNWLAEWETMQQGLMQRYMAAPRRPHCVHEAFLRGNRGYIPAIVAGTSPLGHTEIRGFSLLLHNEPGCHARPAARSSLLAGRFGPYAMGSLGNQ